MVSIILTSYNKGDVTALCIESLLIALDAFIHHIGNVSFIAAGGYPDIGDHNQRIVSTTYCLTVPEETMMNEELTGRIMPNAKRVLHAECGSGAYGLYAQANGCYCVGLESSSIKYILMKNHYSVAIQYCPGEDFNLTHTGFDALVIEKQYASDDTLSLVRSIKPALKEGAQLLLQVLKIVAIDPHSKYYTVYKETWSEDGCAPCYGHFSLYELLEQMSLHGFELVCENLEDSGKGYFNRCAFGRYNSNRPQLPGQLPFFKEWTAEFVFHKKGESQ